MDELFFVCEDVVKETKKIINAATPDCTRGMTDSELQAYNLGITNTLSVLKSVIFTDCVNEFVLNINGFETPTEFTHDDLIRYLNNLMEVYN